MGGSYHMEKEGLKRTLAKLQACGVTGLHSHRRSSPNPNYLRERQITHFSDVWHLEKGVFSSLKNSRTSGCLTKNKADYTIQYQ